jgi:transposase InsO family protein
MGIGRSTFYDTPDARTRELTIVAEMKTICDEFEAYGYRRVDAELGHRGIVVNTKKIRRLMREHALNPKQRRRRFVGQRLPTIVILANAGGTPRFAFCCSSPERLRLGLVMHGLRQTDRKCRAFARFACHRDVAAHHLKEAFADREPQARATVFASGGGIGL